MKSLSVVVESLPRSGIRLIMELAAEMDDVIHLEVGEPDAPTPDAVIDFAFASARAGFTKYSANAGLRSLREAIAARLYTADGLSRRPDEIVVTAGAVAAVANSVFATVDPGDEVLVPDPCWPNYLSIIQLARGIPVRYPLVRDDGFLPDLSAIEALVTAKTKLLITNNPGNPTGAVYPARVVRGLVDLAASHDLFLLADEIYEALVLDGTHCTAASFDTDGRVILVSGFSKAYAMTGWRLGYAVASAPIAAAIASLAEPFVSCPSTISQKGAEAALRLPSSYLDQVRAVYRRRRDTVVASLEPAGLLASRPTGAFYALVDLGRCGADSYEMARALLAEEGVATAPGGTFGPSTAAMVRLSFAAPTEQLEEGCRRILRFAERHSR